MNAEFFPTWRGIQGLHVFHRSVGYACVAVLAASAWLARSYAPARPWFAAAGLLALAEVGVGIANVLLRLPVEITGLHSALAAGLVCSVGVGVRECWRDRPAV